MTEKPIFTEEDNKITELASVQTISKLQAMVETQGMSAALAEAFGMSYGIAHVFRSLGLSAVHRALRKDLAKYVGEGK